MKGQRSTIGAVAGTAVGSETDVQAVRRIAKANENGGLKEPPPSSNRCDTPPS